VRPLLFAGAARAGAARRSRSRPSADRHAADMQRTRCRAAKVVSEQRARARKALRFLATLAVLLMQTHGATASSNGTMVVAGVYHTCAILVSMPNMPCIHQHRAMGI